MKPRRKTDKQPFPEPRVAEIVSSKYQLSVAELREDVHIDMTMAEMGEILMWPVRIRTIKNWKEGL